MRKRKKPEELLRKKSFKVAAPEEAEVPESNALQEWNEEFGWVRLNGHVTKAGQAYFKRLARDRAKNRSST